MYSIWNREKMGWSSVTTKWESDLNAYHIHTQVDHDHWYFSQQYDVDWTQASQSLELDMYTRHSENAVLWFHLGGLSWH